MDAVSNVSLCEGWTGQQGAKLRLNMQNMVGHRPPTVCGDVVALIHYARSVCSSVQR